MSNTKAYEIESFGIGGVVVAPDFGGIASRACKAVVSAFAGCAGFFSSVADSYFRKAKIRRTYEMLADLDDRMLKDIGISRGEIGAVAVHSTDYPDIAYPRRAW